jgi:hypothetical protein
MHSKATRAQGFGHVVSVGHVVSDGSDPFFYSLKTNILMPKCQELESHLR